MSFCNLEFRTIWTNSGIWSFSAVILGNIFSQRGSQCLTCTSATMRFFPPLPANLLVLAPHTKFNHRAFAPMLPTFSPIGTATKMVSAAVDCCMLYILAVFQPLLWIEKFTFCPLSLSSRCPWTMVRERYLRLGEVFKSQGCRLKHRSGPVRDRRRQKVIH